MIYYINYFPVPTKSMGFLVTVCILRNQPVSQSHPMFSDAEDRRPGTTLWPSSTCGLDVPFSPNFLMEVLVLKGSTMVFEKQDVKQVKTTINRMMKPCQSPIGDAF